MRIGVIGYYGYGNAGDEVILDNLRAFLSPHQVTPIPIGFDAAPACIDRLNRYDFLIFGGGGLMQRGPIAPFDTFDRWADNLTTPFGVLGLGVEQPSARYSPTIATLAERSTFFVVRDLRSKDLVAHPKVRVAPDVTFYRPLQPPSAVRPQSGETYRCGVNLRSTDKDAAEWIDSIRALPCTLRGVLLSSHPDYGEWSTLKQLDPDSTEHFSPQVYAEIDLLIGAAFHSVVFAIQNCVPVIAINNSLKVQRLMQELGFDEFLLEWDERERLASTVRALLHRKDDLRARMASYTASAAAQLAALRQEILPQLVDAAGKRKIPALKPKRYETVSILVQCHEAREIAFRKTIRACLEQAYAKVEVVCIARPAQIELLAAEGGRDGRLVFAEADSGHAMPLAAALQSARGDYLTIVNAGDWFAEDAVAAMVAAIGAGTRLEGVCADYFLTHEGVIEREIVSSGDHVARWGGRGSLCYLLRRTVAREWFAANLLPSGETIQRVSPSARIGYLPCALLHVEASRSELLLYRSVIAFRMGQVDLGRSLMTQAIDADPELCRWQLANLSGLLEQAARRALATASPSSFLGLFFDSLPEAARALSVLHKPLLSRVAMAQFFSACEQGAWKQALRQGCTGIKHDPMWLRNRGVVKALLVAGSHQLPLRSAPRPPQDRT